ncbi:MAG: HpcH/HpaI aldolase family protein [Saprospiraceae bacterium]
MMYDNRVKAKMRSGNPVYGVISPTTDPVICEYLGWAGLDFYMIDGEHGPIGPAEAANLVRACELSGTVPLARVRSLDEKLILQFLDAGVMGIMMPGVQTMADIESLVKAVRYPPIGNRGVGPVRAANYMMGPLNQKDYVALANREILILPQVEDLHAVENLREMAAHPEVDGFIIGPRDLAMSMGYLDGPNHPEVQEVIQEIFKVVLESGKLVGTVAGTADQARALVAKGATMILNSVQGLLSSGVNTFLKP